MKRTDYILVADSGEGGKYTLNRLKQRLPNENFIYFQDSKNAPYGNKSKRKLTKIATNNMRKLLKDYSIKLVVLACNTMSSVVIDSLRRTFIETVFVTIEPVINSSDIETLVLCTSLTKKFNRRLKAVRKNPKIKVYGFKTLAKKIDDNMKNLNALQPYISKKLKKYKKFEIKNVVLGCTHYNYIKPQISTALNSRDLTFTEGSEHTAEQTVSALKAINMKSKRKKTGVVIYLSS